VLKLASVNNIKKAFKKTGGKMGFMISKPENTGLNWEPVPQGVYASTCYAVVDLGTHINELYGNKQHKCWIAWEFPNELIEIETDGKKEEKPRIIAGFYTVSLHEKSNLRRVLESWRGRGFSDDELEGFDISKILDTSCLINVIHKPKANDATQVRATIGAIMPMTKDTPKLTRINPLTYFSFEDHGVNIPEEIPQGIKDMIMKSEEYKELTTNPEGEWKSAPGFIDDDECR
jgi:hypothetical protein